MTAGPSSENLPQVLPPEEAQAATVAALRKELRLRYKLKVE